jgi:hypothetical protein
MTWGGEELYLRSFLSFGTGRATFKFRPLNPQGKGARNTLSRRLGEPQSRSSCNGLEKSFRPRREPNPDCRILITILTPGHNKDVVKYLV